MAREGMKWGERRGWMNAETKSWMEYSQNKSSATWSLLNHSHLDSNFNLRTKLTFQESFFIIKKSVIFMAGHWHQICQKLILDDSVHRSCCINSFSWGTRTHFLFHKRAAPLCFHLNIKKCVNYRLNCKSPHHRQNWELKCVSKGKLSRTEYYDIVWTATSKTKLIYFYKNSETAQNLRVCSLAHQPNICIRTDWQIWSLQFLYNEKMPVLGVFSYIHTDVCEFILQQAAGFKRCNFYLEGKLCFLCLLDAHFSFRMN